MINSARARHLADLTTDIPAAYYGFIDRFNRVPGDWDAGAATLGLGVPVDNGGVGALGNNGRIDSPAGSEFLEPNALWEQLAKAGIFAGAQRSGCEEGIDPRGTAEGVSWGVWNWGIDTAKMGS